MQVQELFRRLSYGELSSLSIGMEGAGTIADGKEEQVLSSIELALTSLYSRFKQRTSFLVLEAMEGISSYVLDPRHAESNTDEPHTTPRYIKDVSMMLEAFPDDLIRIIEVTRLDDPETKDVDEEKIFPINAHRSGRAAVKILAYNELKLLQANPGDLFEIEYQAKHPKLTVGGTIQIMPALEEALQARTAAAIFSGMTGEAHVARAAELLTRYEQLCQMVLLNDMAQESGSDEFDKLRARGFI